MSAASPIVVQLGDAEVRVPPQAAARAYIEQMIEQGRTIDLHTEFAVPTILAPAIGAYWAGQGGHYAGIGRGGDGKPDFHIIVPQMPKLKVDHANALRRAVEVEIDGHRDFELLTKAVAPICNANVPELFEKEWHWLADTQAAGAGSAWVQTFDYGCQHWGHKGNHGLVRAFRRLPIR